MTDLSEVSQDNLQFILDVVRLLQSNPYGETNFSIQSHRSKVVSLTTNEFKNKKYYENQNAQAIAELMTIIKQLIEKKENIPVTFTLMFGQGNIREIMYQTYRKIPYSSQKL